MAGSNQHHIPRFLQRGFAVQESNQNKIWRFEKDKRPPSKPGSIRSTGSEPNFYSEPSADGAPTLDDHISSLEHRIAAGLNALRECTAPGAVDAAIAADLVTHLAPRTAHFRKSLEHGMQQIIRGSDALFTGEDKLEALLGLDQPAPNWRFQEVFAEQLKTNALLASLGLPDAVVERMAFHLARENFGKMTADAIPLFRKLFAGWLEGAADLVRTAHNKALGEAPASNARHAFLLSLDWNLGEAPSEGAILPDCVAIAVTGAGAIPMMLADPDDITAIIMPICDHILLIGRKAGRTAEGPLDFNRAAARASHHFFLAATDSEAIAALHPLIDERSTALVEAAVDEAFHEILPRQPNAEGQDEDQDRPPAAADDETPPGQRGWNVELTIDQSPGEDESAQIIAALKPLLGGLAPIVPLGRLAGITIAADYPAAVAAIDRGLPGAAPPTTVQTETLRGVAQTIKIWKDGRFQCRVVVDLGVAMALVSDDVAASEWAIRIFVRQFLLVMLAELVDDRIPGAHLDPVADPLPAWLYPCVQSAIEEYVLAHMMAGFGDRSALLVERQDRLAEALDEMRSTILPARFAYRFDDDIDRLANLARARISDCLHAAADLLGHAAALGEPPVEPGSALERALEAAGLTLWLPRFGADLDRFRARLGEWDSFDEFLAFTAHVERLLWQLGMIVWLKDQKVWVEVPIGTDDAALQAHMLVEGFDADGPRSV